ncbi:hypothetical protein GCM10010191_91160 [Actinomadura vinacea]|uniref:ABC transporter permease n=1 Tax=Actinomadura vinacea TaxID=115336 RepID=A0ABN3KE67_9ACTN
MIALVRFQVAGYVRSLRALQPLIVVFLLSLVVLQGSGDGAKLAVGTLGDLAAFMFPVWAWTARALLDTQPDEQRSLSALAVRSNPPVPRSHHARRRGTSARAAAAPNANHPGFNTPPEPASPNATNARPSGPAPAERPKDKSRTSPAADAQPLPGTGGSVPDDSVGAADAGTAPADGHPGGRPDGGRDRSQPVATDLPMGEIRSRGGAHTGRPSGAAVAADRAAPGKPGWSARRRASLVLAGHSQAVAGVLAAYSVNVGLGALVLAVPMLQAYGAGAGTAAPLMGVGLSLLVALAATVLGAWTSRAIIADTGISLLALIGGVVAALLLSLSPLSWVAVPMVDWLRAAHAGPSAFTASFPGIALRLVLWIMVVGVGYLAVARNRP